MANRITRLLLQQSFVTMQGVERSNTFSTDSLQVLVKLRQGDLHVRYEVLKISNKVSLFVQFRATAQPLNAAKFAESNRFPYRGRARLLLILLTKRPSH